MIVKLYPILTAIPMLFLSSYDRNGDHYLWAWEGQTQTYDAETLDLRPPVSPYSTNSQFGHRLVPGCDTTPRRLERVHEPTGTRSLPPLYHGQTAHHYIVCLNANPDYNRDGVLDGFDVVLFLDYYNTGDPRADLNGDGVHDAFDVQAFTVIYDGGFTIQETTAWLER